MMAEDWTGSTAPLMHKRNYGHQLNQYLIVELQNIFYDDLSYTSPQKVP